MSSRKFLLLQGVATPFFKELGKSIRHSGYEVFRVNFCGGDSFSSGLTPSWRFSDTLDKLGNWLQAKHTTHGFTDAILFGDTRPVHTHAIPALKALGVRIHVYEEGYMRPDWITLEQNGVNGYSQLLQKDADFWQHDYPITARDQPTLEVGASFPARALHDICYRLANAILSPLYPHYQTHRPMQAWREYLGWIQRFPVNKLWRGQRDTRLINNLVKQNTPFYLLPLQLDSDAQIRVHSPFDNMEQVINTVMESFARHAPAESILVIKNHPLDTGLLRHEQTVGRIAGTLGLEQRIIFLETGHLPTLLDHTQGTVLVNSTTGTSSLYHGSPTIALGTAIFDLPGLTFQHGLDRFWVERQPPNQELYRRFRHAVIELTQIKGNFYSRRGMLLAIEGSLRVMQILPPTEADTLRSPETAHPLPAPVYGGKMPETSYHYKKR